MHSERYITGQKMLQQVDGKGGDAVVRSLKEIAPDFARYLLEFPPGDIYARPGLDLRSRGNCGRHTRDGKRRAATKSAYCRRATRGVNTGGDY